MKNGGQYKKGQLTQEAELGLNLQASSGLLGIVWQRASGMVGAVVMGSGYLGH